MFDLGFQELLVIFIVALLVFGPKKLPELGRTLGKWIGEIKRGVQTAKIQIEAEFDETDKKSFHGNENTITTPDKKPPETHTDSKEPEDKA